MQKKTNKKPKKKHKTNRTLICLWLSIIVTQNRWSNFYFVWLSWVYLINNHYLPYANRTHHHLKIARTHPSWRRAREDQTNRLVTFIAHGTIIISKSNNFLCISVYSSSSLSLSRVCTHVSFFLCFYTFKDSQLIYLLLVRDRLTT